MKKTYFKYAQEAEFVAAITDSTGRPKDEALKLAVRWIGRNLDPRDVFTEAELKRYANLH